MAKRRLGEVVRDLEAIVGEPRLVRITRTGDLPGDIEGFVVGIGVRWAVVAWLHPEAYIDGFTTVRLRDVRRVRVFPKEDWRERALTPELDRLGASADLVDPTTTGTLLRTASSSFGVITVRREQHGRGKPLTGRVRDLADKHLSFEVLDAETIAVKGVRSVPFGQLSRIDFGGRRNAGIHRGSR